MITLPSPVSLTFAHGVSYSSAPARQPLVSVEFAATDARGVLRGSLKTVAMIDSGADLTVLDTSLAQILGIDLSKLPAHTVKGVTGQASSYNATLLLRLCGRWLPVAACFVPGVDTPLLGRQDIFDTFQIAFLHRWGLAFANDHS